MSRRDNGDGNVWYDEVRDLWRARVSIDGFPKPKYPTADTRAKLNAKIKQLKKETPPSGVTVRSAAEEWLRDHAHPPTCRQSTYDQYSYLMRVHILPAIGDMAVELVRPKDIQRIISSMRPVTARKTPLSPRTRSSASSSRRSARPPGGRWTRRRSRSSSRRWTAAAGRTRSVSSS